PTALDARRGGQLGSQAGAVYPRDGRRQQALRLPRGHRDRGREGSGARRDREEGRGGPRGGGPNGERGPAQGRVVHPLRPQRGRAHQDRKSTRLNSSHVSRSYAVHLRHLLSIPTRRSSDLRDGRRQQALRLPRGHRDRGREGSGARRDREEGRGGPRGGGPNGERGPAQGRVVHPLRPQRGRAHQAGRESGRDAYLRAGRARAPRAAVHEDHLARAGGHLMGPTFTGSPRLAAAARTATFTGSPRLAAAARTATFTGSPRLRLAPWPRDVQRLALPFTGSPWTAGPGVTGSPRLRLRLALRPRD